MGEMGANRGAMGKMSGNGGKLGGNVSRWRPHKHVVCDRLCFMQLSVVQVTHNFRILDWWHAPIHQPPCPYCMRCTCQRANAPAFGDLKTAPEGVGGGGTDARRRRGAGVGEMGFRARPFVLCNNGFWRQRRRNTSFGPKKGFSTPPLPQHMCSQNDQRGDVGIILSR